MTCDGGQEWVINGFPPQAGGDVMAMAISGCHSLMDVEGKAIGDPIEVAALRAVKWSYEPSKATASPGAWRAKELMCTYKGTYFGILIVQSDQLLFIESYRSSITACTYILQCSLGFRCLM